MSTSVTANGFVARTDGFDGPLDLLLTLIERRKMHISEVSLARIADDYLAYIEEHEEFPVRDTAHFLLVASTLVLIKSRSLLPSLSLTEEEEGSIDDLEERLKIYQRIRDLAEELGKQYGVSVARPRERSMRSDDVVFSPTSEVETGTLHGAIQNAIAGMPQREHIPQAVVQRAVTLEEMMQQLSDRISRALTLSFREFSQKGKREKVDVVVGFLAILELVKRGLVDVSQEEQFGDIQMESSDVSLPRYY